MGAREDFLAIKTPDDFNRFREKHPGLKLTEFDADMARHFNTLNAKWNKIPREINGVHYDTRKKNPSA